MEEKKEASLWSRGGGGGTLHDSLGTKSNRPDLAIFSAGIKLLSVEMKVDTPRVSGLDDDFFSPVDGALSAGRQEFGFDPFAVSRDRDPGLVADLDLDGELSRSGGSGLRCLDGG